MKTPFLCTIILGLIIQTGIAQNPSYPPNSYKEIALPALLQKLKQGDTSFVVLDVRTPGEYHDTLTRGMQLNIGRIKGAVNMDVNVLRSNPDAVKQLDKYRDKDIYVICSHSYRSRVVSNLLLEKGFASVTNVKGGMSEWYRNAPAMDPFKPQWYLHKASNKNLSPAELYKKISADGNIAFFGFVRTPANRQDSAFYQFYQMVPDFKNASWHQWADTLQLLEKAKQLKNKTIVAYNISSNGAAELSDLLSRNGINNVYYLVGNLTGFVEYMQNYQPQADLKKYFNVKSAVSFVTPMAVCRSMQKGEPAQLVDLRVDSLFNKMSNGTKLNYKHLKGAVNIPPTTSADEFAAKFTDKKKQYVIITSNPETMPLAEALTKNGYRIAVILGGNERWEWYTNNLEDFACKDQFE